MKANFNSTIKTETVSVKPGEESKPAVSVNESGNHAWYMREGSVRPSVGANSSIALYPEESPGKDRVTDQLMFILPHKKEEEVKRILMWNGVSSWGGVRPGREEFLKQECPVDTCSIITDREEAEQVDMVLFKDHFILPTFNRSQSQIWMIFMLGITISPLSGFLGESGSS